MRYRVICYVESLSCSCYIKQTKSTESASTSTVDVEAEHFLHMVYLSIPFFYPFLAPGDLSVVAVVVCVIICLGIFFIPVV